MLENLPLAGFAMLSTTGWIWTIAALLVVLAIAAIWFVRERSRPAPAAPRRAAPDDDLTAESKSERRFLRRRLAELDELRNRELITDDEYRSAKAEARHPSG